MNRDLHCPYSILNADILCEHKSARIEEPNTSTLHNHDGYEMLLFLNGEASIFVESEEKKLSRGDFVIIPPYAFHGIRVANIEQYERVVLNLRPHVLAEVGDEKTDFTACLTPDEGKFCLVSFAEQDLEQVIMLFARLENSLFKKQFGHSVLSKAYLTEFLVELSHFTTHQSASDYENIMSPTVRKIFDYIDENIRNELSVEIIAHKLHHNSDYLGRVFKDATGGSLKYYINAKKIALAQQLLREGYPPYDVCFMLCFNNYSSFSRCFSRHIGLSPKQYLSSIRREPR